MNIPEALEDYHVITPVKIRWSDMDAGMIVNNVHYLRWMEIGRTDMLEKAGVTDFTGQIIPIGVVVGKVSCTYIRPLAYPDTVLVASRVRDIKEDRFIVENALYSVEHKQMAAIGEVRLVTFDLRKMQKTAIPDYLREGLLEMKNEE